MKGLKETVRSLPQSIKLVVVTVGLADPSDEDNIRNIRTALGRQLPERFRNTTPLFHLRGGIAYQKLSLSDAPNSSETKLMMGEVDATSFHKGIDSDGTKRLYPLKLSDESDGTRKLMAMAPGIAHVLACGGVFLADGIDMGLHVGIIEMLISKFQSKKTNPYHAQLIVTTHNTELLNMELIRKDQIYFADKSRKDGSSSLYSISEFATPTTENVLKGYLM